MSARDICGKITANGTPCPSRPRHVGSCFRTPTVVEVIDLEAENLRPARREEQIRIRFGMSTARYQGILASFLDTDTALQHNPILVNRLRARRDGRVLDRAARAHLTAPRKDQP